MNSTKLILRAVFLATMVSVLAFSSSASLNHLELSPDSSEVEVPGTVELTGEVEGDKLNSAVIEYKDGSSWNKIGTTRGCVGETCTIVREYSESSEGTVEFRLRAADDDGNIESSDRVTVEFLSDENGGDDPEISSVSISSDRSEVEVPGTVELTGEIEGQSLNSARIEYEEDGQWNKIGTTRGCTGTSCAIVREYSESSEGPVDFRLKAADDDGNIETSDEITVNFVSSGDNDPEISSVSISSDRSEVEVPGIVNLDAEASGNKLDEITIEYRESGEYTWNKIATSEECSSDSCSIVRQRAENEEGTEYFRAEVTDQSGDTKTSSVISVNFREIGSPFFDVSIIDTNSPVDEGENLKVKYRVSNTGDERDTQQLKLRTSGTFRDSDTVTLDPGRSTTGNLYWNTRTGDEGSYTAKVSSRDSSDSTSVTVRGDRQNSEIVAKVRDDSGSPLDASVSLDSRTKRTGLDGEAVFSSLAQGTYTVRAEKSGYSSDSRTVSLGRSETRTVRLTLSERNRGPDADFSFSPREPRAGEQVTFDASASSDDGRIVDYSWRFGDGTSGSGEVSRHTYRNAGSYPVTLTVRDDDGATDSRTRTIEVREGGPECGVDRSQISFSVSDKTIREGESTKLRLKVNNNADENQRVETRLKLGRNLVKERTVRVPANGYREVTSTVSPEKDVYARADVETSGDPCGSRSFGPFNSKITVISDPGDENRPPVADFTYSPVDPDTEKKVSFDASDSYDPDGSIVDYSWDFGDGRQGAGRRVDHSYSDPGEYPVELTVEDNEGATDTETATVVVSSGPEPICGISRDRINLNAKDKTIQQGESTQVSLKVYNDGVQNQRVKTELKLGNDLVKEKTVSVPANGYREITSVVSPEEDVFVRGTVTTEGSPCGTKSFGPFNQKITVLSDPGDENRPPVADFTFSPPSPQVGEKVSFDASDSFDPDGNIVDYSWRFGDGSRGSGRNTDHRFEERGDYPVELTVEDNKGVKDTRTATVHVSSGPAPECGISKERISLNVEDSVIEEGESTQISFEVYNDAEENQRVVAVIELGNQEVERKSLKVPSKGSRMITKSVSPDEDVFVRATTSTEGSPCGNRQFGPFNQKITIVSDPGDENRLPVADFTYSPVNPETGERVSFDASDSFDPDGNIVDYSWRFGDGSRGAGRETDHTYSEPGTYPVVLTVEDDEGATSTETHKVTVGEPDRKCGIERSNLELRMDDQTIRQGESTDANLRVHNTAEENQRIEVKFKVGTNIVDTREVTVPGFGSRTLSQRVSPEKDAFVRAEVEARGDPCGNRDLGQVSKKLIVLSDPEEDATLNVDVYDSDYNAVRNARVEVDGPERKVRYTSGSGSAGFRLQPGFYTVQVSHPDYETDSKTVRLFEGDREELEFKLDRLRDEGRLEVNVRDRSGNSIEDARVRVRNGEDRTRRTDSRGFTSFGLTPDTYEIRVTHPDYSGVARGTARIRAGETTVRNFRLGDSRRDGITVASTSYSDTVCRGGTLSVDVSVENRGDRNEYVTLTGKGLGSNVVLDSFIIERSQTKRRTVRFTDVEGTGSETFRIQARNGTRDEVSRTVRVQDCVSETPTDPTGISMKLSYPVAPNRAIVGDTVKVSGFVDGVNRRTEVTIDVDGEQKSKVSTQPDGYYQTYIRADSIGMKTVRARAGGNSASRQLEVLPTARVGHVEAPRKIFEGEDFEVCAEVDSQVDAKVLLLRDGEVIDSTNDRGRVCFDEEAYDPGRHVYEVRALTSGEDSSSRTTVEVLETDVEVSSFPDQVASIESGNGIVKVELYNTKNEMTRYNLELEGLPSTWLSQSEKQVVLTPGERRDVFFYLTPRDEGRYDPELIVEARNQEVFQQKVDLEVGGTDKPRRKGLVDRVRGLIGL